MGYSNRSKTVVGLSGVLLAVVMSIVAASPLVAQVIHECIDNPVFPEDCPDQLGKVGGPPIRPADEGFLNIAAPVVDPVLLLRSSNASDGLLYVLNPLHNRVRLLAPERPGSERGRE